MTNSKVEIRRPFFLSSLVEEGNVLEGLTTALRQEGQVCSLSDVRDIAR